MPDSTVVPPRPPKKLSGFERTKAASNHLRGAIAETLADAAQPVFAASDAGLMKAHGIYQQYDRDTATERKQRGEDKDHIFMVRSRIPAGRLTASQYLALDDLAGRVGNGTLRVTTRQTVQFHGIVKGDLKTLIAGINRTLLTTLAACGDVVRNVTATPAPIRDNIHRTLHRLAGELSTHLLPRTRAYHEIWIDGEKLDQPEIEPLLGDTYLPRKFKIGLAEPSDNSIDVMINDLAVIALFDGQDLQGFNLAVGGSLGMTHNKPKTYPRLASPLLFVEPEGLLAAVEAVICVQRDHGDRADRKHARLKYLVDDKGLPWIKAMVEAAAGRTFDAPRPMPRFRIVDHLGWHEQGDGLWYFGIPLPSGRIADTDGATLRSALRRVIETWRPGVVLSPNQDILLCDIADGQRQDIEAELRRHGVVFGSDLSPLHRWTLACPALPTCGLALTEAERIRKPVTDQILERLARHGLAGERMSLRITGCPNGCARSYAGDIGLVGRMPGYYAIYVGGDFEGTRLSFRLYDRVAQDAIADWLEPLFALFAAERQADEGFGDFCYRVGAERLAGLAPEQPDEAAAELELAEAE